MTRANAMRMVFSLNSRALNQSTTARQLSRTAECFAFGSMESNIGTGNYGLGRGRANRTEYSEHEHMPLVIVDPSAPEDSVIGRAAEILRRGGLVAFPTETVYGLSANALHIDAVERVYAAN